MLPHTMLEYHIQLSQLFLKSDVMQYVQYNMVSNTLENQWITI